MYVVHYTLHGQNDEEYDTKTEYNVDSEEAARQKAEKWNSLSQYWTIEIEKVIETKY